MHASSLRLLRLFCGGLEVLPVEFEMLSLTLGAQATGQCYPVTASTRGAEMAMLKVKPSLEISLETAAAKQQS